AQRLGVPVSTVNYWRTAKKGPHYVKVGRHVRYLPESVDKYVLELMATQEGENNDR
ncbi:TPA: helix-turn-helix domain-containing protein, partial [Corynebacterium striatum]|nr:helix-turn-helix domain-containing protein [Corynebacterium striatum]HCG2998602.1 helix-turn-helix domain-containing protein [Corynebacterium striatum]HCG3003919.1 helix-turn-helix domain-containing protein [Corynebacterium striatum]HCG3006556.1 helix-turn-helix domain-containing protein [Corynebacterium striatum]HCG3009182.1 helix-turn-helix domain-containing protein [Corynebacterium striatum]